MNPTQPQPNNIIPAIPAPAKQPLETETSPFQEVVQHAVKHQRLPIPSTHLYRNQSIFKYLPIIKTRPPPIVTKIPYSLSLNPQNIHDESYEPLRLKTTSSRFKLTETTPPVLNSQSLFPFNDVSYMYSPYGPTNFQLTTTPFYPELDQDYHINPTPFGKLLSWGIIKFINNSVGLGLALNKVYTDNNDDLIYKTVESNQDKDPLSPDDPKRPIITFSNHNSTLDDPFIIINAHPSSNLKTCRWEICGQDICFLTPFITSGFLAGRVLPIQRGSGLHQPHFTRLHNLLANGEWVHLFPEAKVQFTPTINGQDHELDDPPAELLPFRWGVGALVSEALLRGQKPSVIPMAHTTARVHPRSNGMPRLNTETSLLVGDDVSEQVKPIVDGYIQQVLAYEENRWPVEPAKERLFEDVTKRLKHALDTLYHNVEQHKNVPKISKFRSVLSKYKDVVGENVIPTEKLLEIEPDIRHSCHKYGCFCQFDDGFEVRESYRRQLLFRDQIMRRQVDSLTVLQQQLQQEEQQQQQQQQQQQSQSPHSPQPQPQFSRIRPWFNTIPLSDRIGPDSTATINQDELGPHVLMDYYSAFAHLIESPSLIPPSLPLALQMPAPTTNQDGTPLTKEQLESQEETTRKLNASYQTDLALSQQPFSTHNIPTKLKVMTNIWRHKMQKEDEYHYDLSMLIEKHLKPMQRWGKGKYNLGLDGVSSQSHDRTRDQTQNQTQTRGNWYGVWRDRVTSATDEFVSYSPSDHTLYVDKAHFEATWKGYMGLSYESMFKSLKKQLMDRATVQAEEFNKKQEDEYQKQQQQQQPHETSPTQANEKGNTPQGTQENGQKGQKGQSDQLLSPPEKIIPKLSKSDEVQLEYLTEVFLMRNRLEYYRRTLGFDWNGV